MNVASAVSFVWDTKLDFPSRATYASAVGSPEEGGGGGATPEED